MEELSKKINSLIDKFKNKHGDRYNYSLILENKTSPTRYEKSKIILQNSWSI